MNDWAKLVKKVYAENKKKAGYMLKDAMRDAKKIYKPSANKTAKMHHGKSEKRHHGKSEKRHRGKSEKRHRK